jgi:hypothetical protein
MDRRRISRAIVILTFVALFISCENNIDDYRQFGSPSDSLFKFVGEYLIPKNSLLSAASYITTTDNKNFYFSSMFAREIYHTKRPFKDFIKIGKRGEGPNEYSTPAYIQIFTDNLFYSDINNIFIKRLSLNKNSKFRENKLSNFHGYAGNIGARKFVVDDNFVYILNSISPILNVYSRINGKLIQSLIEIEKRFDLINNRVNGGGIVIDNDNNIFLATTVPYKLYKLNHETDILRIVAEWDFSNFPGIVSLSKKMYNSSDENNRKKSLDLIASITQIINIHLIGEHDQKIIIQLAHNDKIVFHIISRSGQVLHKYKGDNVLFLMGTFGNSLFFYDNTAIESCDNCIAIREFTYTR